VNIFLIESSESVEYGCYLWLNRSLEYSNEYC